MVSSQGMGTSPECVISKLLDEYEGRNKVDLRHEDDIINIGAVVYAGHFYLR